MKHTVIFTSIAFACLSAAPAVQAQTVGNLVGAPVTNAGNAVIGLGIAHAGIAPLVNQLSPTAEPVTDGVTNTLLVAGVGVSQTGSLASANGVQVATQANGQPLVSVGTSNPNQQGSVAAVLSGPHP